MQGSGPAAGELYDRRPERVGGAVTGVQRDGWSWERAPGRS